MADQSFYKQNTLPDLISHETPPPLPDKIGPYHIDSLLNKGGMSLLYLGIHPETKQPISIKVLSPAHLSHPEMVQRFLKEAEIIGLTNHPNIVKLYGEGEWEHGLYIAMEFIRGISLRQFIMQQSLSLKRALEIILQVSYALLHLHAHGVIHRDLKPENILITEDGGIKVIDFGIAQLQEKTVKQKSEKKGVLMGTPNYMSPEQKEDPSSVTFASDIYSLGIIAYELVLGRLSFGIVNLSLLPKGLRTIVAKALAVSATERYQDICDFIADISQYLKSGEIEKERPESDQLKEVSEILQKGVQSLSPLTPPDWPQVELGIAKLKGAQQVGLYYDFFKLPNNTFLLLLGQPTSTTWDAATYVGVLRGMLRMFLRDKAPSPTGAFRPLAIASALNQMLCEDIMQQPFAASFLLLDPFRDQMTFISCGLDDLMHIPQGSTKARKLSSQNMLLGVDALTEFSEISDNWNEGDTIVFSSLDISMAGKMRPSFPLEEPLMEAIEEHILLSPQRQAESILKRVSAAPDFSLQRSPKAVITIQRIS